jgi:hypothetical protein
MAFYNDGDRRKEVGENCTLFLPEGEDNGTPVSNVSFSEEANTSEVQYTNGFTQSIAVTGVTYSGSFTVPGRANTERSAGWSTGEEDKRATTLPQNVGNMTIEDGNGRSYTFSNVLLNSHSKDIPSDDRTEQSFDFMAEKLVADTSGESA